MLSSIARWYRQKEHQSSLAVVDGYETDENSLNGSENGELSSAAAFPDYLQLFPTTRTGKWRPVVNDRWIHLSEPDLIECGSRLFDMVLEQPIECRVFLNSRMLTFQSICEGESDNHTRFAVHRLYLLQRPFVEDYIAIGIWSFSGGFSLVMNGFMVDFVETKDDNVDITERHVNPSQLPRDIRFTVLPLKVSYDIFYEVHHTIRDYRRYMPINFTNCHKLADRIVRRVSFSNMMIAVETSNTSSEPYYKRMKLTPSVDGQKYLIKMF
jgi:hypothetical protein